jgi:hypothetical protein
MLDGWLRMCIDEKEEEEEEERERERERRGSEYAEARSGSCK